MLVEVWWLGAEPALAELAVRPLCLLAAALLEGMPVWPQGMAPRALAARCCLLLEHRRWVMAAA